MDLCNWRQQHLNFHNLLQVKCFMPPRTMASSIYTKTQKLSTIYKSNAIVWYNSQAALAGNGRSRTLSINALGCWAIRISMSPANISQLTSQKKIFHNSGYAAEEPNFLQFSPFFEKNLRLAPWRRKLIFGLRSRCQNSWLWDNTSRHHRSWLRGDVAGTSKPRSAAPRYKTQGARLQSYYGFN
jgi:hypothetical protein